MLISIDNVENNNLINPWWRIRLNSIPINVANIMGIMDGTITCLINNQIFSPVIFLPKYNLYIEVIKENSMPVK